MEAQTLKLASEAKDEAKEAKILAMDAHSKIDSYIKVATIQQNVVIQSITETKGMIVSLYNRAWVIAGTIILLLLGAAGTLAMYILSRSH